MRIYSFYKRACSLSTIAEQLEMMGKPGSEKLKEEIPSQSEPAAMAKFLSFLSHDLRGGLNGAVLMIEVLRRQLSSDPKLAGAVEDLDTVRRSILDTVATMERFLNAERLRLGHLQLRAAPVNVQDMLKEIQRSCNYVLKERDMEMQITVQPPGLTVQSDRQLLVMVIQNLVSNAIKYGRGGTVQVSAHGGDKAPKGVGCRVAVTDCGPGIAPEKISQLFSPFTRGETYGQKGMGLGLYIARHATDLLDGTLSVDSKLGHGCTFFLDLKKA